MDAAHESSNLDKNSTDGSTPGGASIDRRKRRRALISAPIRVRAFNLTENGPDEISTTLDVSRNGVLFLSTLSTFAAGMQVAVAFPYTNSLQVGPAEQSGRIVRITEMPDGRRSVSVALGAPGENSVDAAGRALVAKPPACAEEEVVDRRKLLVLIVDAERAIRESLKTCLGGEGYEVFAVSCAAEAHEVLKMFTPALLIAEIEGDDLPGYELCAHCKATPRLQTVPVVLLTRSAYPSDYANAHSLGAVVCMAKPYRQERLGHIVRLLAPTEQHKQVVAVRPIDPSRRGCARPKRKNQQKAPSIVDSVKHRPPWRV
jgi:CheY-like chemotaxis protein